MTKHRYHINVFYSDEDKRFIADVPDLKYCSAHGRTPEQAVKEIQIAVENWLAAARDSGRRIPEPHYRPVMYQGVTGAAPATKPAKRAKSSHTGAKTTAA